MSSAVESVVFNGVEFRRYPDSTRRDLRVYFKATGGAFLHRATWEHHHGPIPEGWHCHHRDGDSLNNDIDNLECLPAFEHLSHHSTERFKDDEQREQNRQHLESIRPLAAEWHSSEEGRAWHSENGKMAWAGREPVERTCDQCGKAFPSMSHRENDRFCSNNCKSAWRRQAGVDNEDRVCPACGATFRVNRYSVQKSCSKPCAAKVRYASSRDVRACAVCGKSFQVKKSSKRRFCCLPCAYGHRTSDVG